MLGTHTPQDWEVLKPRCWRTMVRILRRSLLVSSRRSILGVSPVGDRAAESRYDHRRTHAAAGSGGLSRHDASVRPNTAHRALAGARLDRGPAAPPKRGVRPSRPGVRRMNGCASAWRRSPGTGRVRISPSLSCPRWSARTSHSSRDAKRLCTMSWPRPASSPYRRSWACRRKTRVACATRFLRASRSSLSRRRAAALLRVVLLVSAECRLPRVRSQRDRAQERRPHRAVRIGEVHRRVIRITRVPRDGT